MLVGGLWALIVAASGNSIATAAGGAVTLFMGIFLLVSSAVLRRLSLMVHFLETPPPAPDSPEDESG